MDEIEEDFENLWPVGAILVHNIYMYKVQSTGFWGLEPKKVKRASYIIIIIYIYIYVFIYLKIINC